MNSFDRKRLHTRIVNVDGIDKGKRHYWGHRRGDYGFYKSSDLDQIVYLSQSKVAKQKLQDYRSLRKMRHQKVQYENLANQSRNSNKGKKRKSLLRIANSFQIQLPPLNRNITLPTENYSQNNFAQNYTIPLNRPNYSNNQLAKDQQEYSKPRVVKTQASEHYYDYTNNKSQKIRYTPTFICSLGNPLSTFKLFSYSDRKN